ncbi:MAG: glycosyltransferase family 4 protein [bacterium]
MLSLEELPLVSRYAPYVVQTVGNAVSAPCGDYARFLLTRRLLRKALIHRLQDDGGTAVLFEDVYTSFPVGVPSLTIVHAVQSDNVYQHSLTVSALRRVRSWDRAAVMRLKVPAATVSHEYRRHIAKALGEDAAMRLGVIPLGIDLEEFPETPHARPAAVFGLVCLGRLEARKNIRFLFEVLSKVVSAGCSRVRLTFLGDGPLRATLEAEAHRRRVSHVVHFAGSVSPTNVPMALQRHHMLLHPSLRESFGYALLEAKVSGLHTVASNNVEVPGDFVDIALPLDADTWAREIVRAYAAWDRGLFRFPSSESLTWLRNRYSIQRMVDSYLAVLLGNSLVPERRRHLGVYASKTG